MFRKTAAVISTVTIAADLADCSCSVGTSLASGMLSHSVVSSNEELFSAVSMVTVVSPVFRLITIVSSSALLAVIVVVA